MKPTILVTTCLFVATFMQNTTRAVPPTLYSDDFDVDSTANWNANAGVGFDSNFNSAPMDSNANFFFDYSSVGIPSDPNSAGGSTRGMKLQASLTSNSIGGFSVSPTAESFTGDYSITFDAWSSTVGPFPFGGSSSTNLSTFGLLTSGTVSNVVLNTDGLWFTYTGDGGSLSDYRAYSVERDFSYQIVDPNNPDPIDLHATHHAGGRDSSEQLYVDAVGPSKTVPQSVIDAVPAADLSGPLFDGAAGFAWH